ncbi:MAG TPA: hypothetical protein VFW96_29790 [Thermomicrobiales bacterium]|nr:hypothetical protein [Thermomicrobiales bacterium]
MQKPGIAIAPTYNERENLAPLVAAVQAADPDLDRRVLAALDLDAVRSSGYAFQIEPTYRARRAGFRVREIPLVFAERERGTSKMSGRIVAEAATLVWRLRLARRRAPRGREVAA